MKSVIRMHLTGGLLNDAHITDMVHARLMQPDIKKGVLLDGYELALAC